MYNAMSLVCNNDFMSYPSGAVPNSALIWIENSSLSGEVYSNPDSSFQTAPVHIFRVLDHGPEIPVQVDLNRDVTKTI